ncbi:collagen-like protein [bacterium]|nr:collagen-like protein [bacterium]
MALARFERDFTDSAGNLIAAAGTVTVRREDSSQLAAVYSDRDGTSALGNPFSVSDGSVAFHAVGGSYRIEFVSGSETRTLRYVALGTAAEQDAEALGRVGYAFGYETETTAPPSAGSIRADSEDLSAATKLFISDETLGGSDISASILDLDPGAGTNLHRLRLSIDSLDAVFQVSGTTAQSGYIEVDISGHDGSAALNAGTTRLNIERVGEVGPTGDAGPTGPTGDAGPTGPTGPSGGMSGTQVTTAVTRSITSSDKGSFVTAAAQTGAIAFNFDAAATLTDTFFVFLQNNGDYDVTLTPDGSELIDGAATLVLAANTACLVRCDGTQLLTSGVQSTNGPSAASLNDPSRLLTLTAASCLRLEYGISDGYEINVSADSVRLHEKAGTGVLDVTSVNLTLDLETSGLLGLDTGSVANDTFYYIYVISNGSITSLLGSLAADYASVTMPSGYTYIGRVGVGLTGTGQLVERAQSGRQFFFDPVTLASNVGSTWSDIDLSAQVPPCAVVGHYRIDALNNTGSERGVYISASNDGPADYASFITPSGDEWTERVECVFATAQEVWAKASNSANFVGDVKIIGFEV